MEYLTTKELQKMMLFAYEKIEKNKEEINKINIFPVPDQDTGNNMAKTLLGIKEAIEGKEFKDLNEISEVILEEALTAAQGNAGVIYTGFLADFLPQLNKNPVDAKTLSLAFKKGAKRARESIQNPREGTILDVIDAAAQTFGEKAEEEAKIINILKAVNDKAKEALLATREKMEIFRKANVVDAGGLAFLMILESYLEALEGERKEEKKEEKPSEGIRKFVQTLSYRYEVVFLIKNPKYSEEILKNKMRNLGDSLDTVQIGNKIKIHIHTDDPEAVREIARGAGQIESLRIEDMAKEVVGEESVRKISIGIVTDDVTGLLPKILERYQIEIVKVKCDWPEIEKFPGKNLYQKMREAEKEGIKTLPKLSQANPQDYLRAYQKQLEKFEKVLCLTISSELSGCYNSALRAKEMTPSPEKIFVFNSKTAAGAQALLVLKAVELILARGEIRAIIKELENLIKKTQLFAVIEDPEWIENTGRMTKSQADWVRKMKKLRLHPFIELKNGRIQKGGIIFAKDEVETLSKRAEKESRRYKGRKIRAVIQHADCPEKAEKLKKELKEKIGAEVSFISLAPSIIGAAAGPGTLILSLQLQ